MKKCCKILLIVFIVFCSYFFVYKFTMNKYSKPEVKYLEVFGKEINVVPGVNYYKISMDNAELHDIYNGCEIPYKIELTKGKIASVFGGGMYDGSDMVYWGFSLDRSIDALDIEYVDGISSVEYYDYYIEVYLDNPLKVSSKCSRR